MWTDLRNTKNVKQWMDEWNMGVWAEWMVGRVNECVGGYMDAWI